MRAQSIFNDDHSALSINNTQWPALVLPSRIKTPFFCMAERSRQIVRGTTDICPPEMNGFFFINSHIFLCLSDSWTTDKLLTSLTTLRWHHLRHHWQHHAFFVSSRTALVWRLSWTLQALPRTHASPDSRPWRHRESFRSHGEYILHPVAVTPAMFLFAIRVWKFRNPKTKRDNAFSICSAPPSGSAHLNVLPSHDGQNAFAKVRKKDE